MLQGRLQKLFDLPGSADQKRRGTTLVLIALVLIGASALGLLIVILRSNGILGVPFFSTLACGLIMVVAILLTHRGMIMLAAWLLISAQFAALIGPIFVQNDNNLILLYLAVPVVASGLILRPWHVLLVTLIGLLVILSKVYSLPIMVLSQEYTNSTISNITVMLVIVGAVSQLGSYTVQVSFSAAEASNTLAEETAVNLAQLNAALEDQIQARTAELRTAFAEVQARDTEKQSLLDEIASQRVAIRQMSVPVLPVSDQTLVMPLVGDIDGERMVAIQSAALAQIERSRARTLLIDLTGVAVVDTYVAQGLLRMVQSARLLGTRSVLIGIRPEVAQALVSLGIDMGDVHTSASLASALSL